MHHSDRDAHHQLEQTANQRQHAVNHSQLRAIRTNQTLAEQLRRNYEQQERKEKLARWLVVLGAVAVALLFILSKGI